MKKLAILCTLICVLLGCSKDFESIQNEIGTTTKMPSTKMAGDGNWDVLGFGYDVIEGYLAPTSVKNAVIDIDKLSKDHAGLLYTNSSTSGYNRYTYGSSAKEYLRDLTREVKAKLAVGAAVDELFKSTIEMHHYTNSKSSYSNKYSFASCDVIKNVKRIYVSANKSLLLNYLNPHFVSDLQTLSANEIIKRYGTHVLTDFTIGGRLNLIYKSTIIKTNNSDTKKIYVKAGINAVLKYIKINIDGSIDNQLIETHNNENTNKELYVEYYGGEGSGTSYNLETGNPSINVHQWESSVNKNNAALTNISWEVAYPLSDFVTDPVKKQQIISAIKYYIENGQLEELKMLPVFTRNLPSSAQLFFEYYEEPPRGARRRVKSEFKGGYIFTQQEQGTVPLYFYGGNTASSNRSYPRYYTTTYKGAFINGLKFNNIVGYCYATPQSNTVELKLNEKGDQTFPPFSVYLEK